MPDVYNLYNKYIRINGRWEKLNDSAGSSSSEDVLTFKESITASQLTNLDINTTNVSDVYNIIDGFTTDNRFIEGAGVVNQPGTCIAVIERNGNKYFNIVGRTFNIDYIQSQITALQMQLDALNMEWDQIEDKPFSYVGEGLDVTNDTLNASPLLDDIAALQLAISQIRVDWDHLDNKPFSTIGSGLTVVNDELKTVPIDWDDVENKPFETIGNSLVVTDGELNVDSLPWESVSNKPFDELYSYDFVVRTVTGGKKRLYISNNYSHSSFGISQMVELRNILNGVEET